MAEGYIKKKERRRLHILLCINYKGGWLALALQQVPAEMFCMLCASLESD
jgi:hypothetical protein